MTVKQLASALEVTEGVIAGVSSEQAHLQTPCPDYDVTRLMDHLVGYATHFADKANGVDPPADATKVTAGADPQAAYHEQADRLADGYKDGEGEEATPLGVVLMETILHGWDLAVATGQPAPYSSDSADLALKEAQGMMTPKFRGEGMPFGEEVSVPDDASTLDRLVGFMGRDPQWTAS